MSRAELRHSRLYVVGGRQRAARSLSDTDPVWQGYDRGLVLELDNRTGEVSSRFEYVSPEDVIGGEEAAICLQSSTIEGDLLFTCTETEVMVYSLPTFERLHYVSLPIFNDLHHVAPTAHGTILVANAGLEMVLEITRTGDVLNAWSALFDDPWERIDRDVDYRKVSTKPHRAHPNFVFQIGDEIWATRFEQGDAVSLTAPERKIDVSDKRIHDGVVHGSRVYFTTVDGKIVVADIERLDVVDVIDLADFHSERAVLGWCRGILIDGDHLWVGFSRIRPTRFRENVSWVAHGFRHGKPTRVVCYDLANRECVAEIDLEPGGLSALYSILPADGGEGGAATSS